jgi:hypothetical protein
MHLRRFEIRGREYGLSREGAVFFDTDARKVLIGDLKLRRMERFTYEYDFGDSWIHEVRIEATLPIDPVKRYPVCVAGKCSAPPEDCGGPDAFMENRWRYVQGGFQHEDHSSSAHRKRRRSTAHPADPDD